MGAINRISRKQFMRSGAGVVAAGAMAGSGVVPARAESEGYEGPSWARLPKIDVHHHTIPADYVKALAGIGILGAGGGPFPAWTAAGSLALMDSYNIAVAILSLSAPGVYFGDRTFAVNLARQVNIETAATVQQYPSRFGFFACLPLPLVSDAVVEAQHAIETLGADGVVILSNTNNVYLGDPSFDPLMAYLDSVSARVFVHPNLNPLLVNVGTVNNAGMVVPPLFGEFVFDTSRAVINLFYNGVTARYPNIKFILAHAGGTVPYIAGRISYMANLPAVAHFYPNGLLPEFSKFYYDTALSAFSYPQATLASLVPRENILLGSDYPFAPPPIVTGEFTALADPAVIRPSLRTKVAFRNALGLFPRLARLL